MGLFNRYGNRYEERRRAKREVLLITLFIVFVILFLGGMWGLSQWGPRAVGEEDMRALEGLTSAEIDDRRTEVTKYQVQFDALIDDGDISEEDLEVLQQAIRKQRELVRLMDFPEPRDQDLLIALEERYATSAGGVLQKASVEAEGDARKAAQEGRHDDAVAALDRAIELQEKINLLYARGDYRDVPRLRRLEVQKSNFEAAPLAQRAEELTQEARMVMTENPLKAEALLREALKLHDTLVRDYRSSRYTNRTAQRKVREMLIDVEAAGQFSRREALRKQAQAAVKADQFVEAAELIEKAIEVQREIMSRYPDSSYAEASELQVLESERQSALSTRLARSVAAKELALRQLLRDRKVAAAGPLAAELFREVRQMHDQFQASRYLDENRLLEARYLNLKRDDLGAIQDAVYDRLRPVPGSKTARMLTGEVPQLLFSLVMGTNPSSQQGDRLPVDSVDFATTQEFCERLGWILGRTVRLCTREEFTAALGEVRSTDLTSQVWSSQNADRRTQEVCSREANANGFYDLLGNVSEWIDEKRPGDERQALIMGGSVRDSTQNIGRVPAAFAAQTERSRFTGFRVVVEIDAP